MQERVDLATYQAHRLTRLVFIVYGSVLFLLSNLSIGLLVHFDSQGVCFDRDLQHHNLNLAPNYACVERCHIQRGNDSAPHTTHASACPYRINSHASHRFAGAGGRTVSVAPVMGR